MPISLPVDHVANELLSRNPLALLLAMLLDESVCRDCSLTRRARRPS